MNTYLAVNSTKSEWQPAGDGVERMIMSYDANIMLVKVRFKVNSICDPHSHPHTQLTYVEKGIFEMVIDGKICVLTQGESCYIAPNIVHHYRCIEEGILLDCFSPCRTEFLDAGV